MFIVVLDGMAYSDSIVFAALKALLNQHGDQAVITASMISTTSGVPYGTTRDALKRLITAGRIAGEQVPGHGCRYRIDNGSDRSGAA